MTLLPPTISLTAISGSLESTLHKNCSTKYLTVMSCPRLRLWLVMSARVSPKWHFFCSIKCKEPWFCPMNSHLPLSLMYVLSSPTLRLVEELMLLLRLRVLGPTLLHTLLSLICMGSATMLMRLGLFLTPCVQGMLFLGLP